MNEIVKCGEKGRHLEIPEGYEILPPDYVVTEDMFDHCRVANIRDLKWERLDEEDLNSRCGGYYDHVIINWGERDKALNQKNAIEKAKQIRK